MVGELGDPSAQWAFG